MNKSVLIIESCEKRLDVPVSTSVAHVRNSIIVSKELGWDLIGHESEISRVADKKYDAIICMYGSPYQKYQQYLKVLLNNPQAKMFWFVNDHDLEDNILLRRWLEITQQPYHMICNNPREGYRPWILAKNILGKKLNDWIDEWHTVNLNSLIFNMDEFEAGIQRPRTKGVVYYGTFRKWRMKDMLEFNGVPYHLSCSQKNFDKFLRAGVRGRWVDRMHWGKLGAGAEGRRQILLSDYKYTFYIEDEHTHDNYAFMANRYYEAVMNRTLMFFHSKCSKAVTDSGYDIPPFLMVDGANDLNAKMAELDSDREKYAFYLGIQCSNVPKIMQDRENALNQIKEAVCKK